MRDQRTSIFRSMYSLETVILPDLEHTGGWDTGNKLYWLHFSANGNAGETFRDCYKLKKVVLPKAKHVARFCFKACESLDSVIVPNAEFIGYGAFSMVGAPSNSSSLSYVYAPKVDSIGLHAFQKCISLTELVLGANVPKVFGYIGNGNCKGGSKVERVDATTGDSGSDGSAASAF